MEQKIKLFFINYLWNNGTQVLFHLVPACSTVYHLFHVPKPKTGLSGLFFKKKFNPFL